MQVYLDAVRQVIDLEPELPGGMPNEMWEAIRNNREACELAFKVTVKETKAGILKRLEKAIETPI